MYSTKIACQMEFFHTKKSPFEKWEKEVKYVVLDCLERRTSFFHNGGSAKCLYFAFIATLISVNINNNKH
eukprot:m.39248 g.39248  ORF g.39248 m.39248 type:complete len:70 (+) comp10281_c0_seq1:3263-3472(+)